MKPTDERVVAVLDILAPIHHRERMPIFELGHETTPTCEQMVELALDIVEAVETAQRSIASKSDVQP